MNDWPVLHKTNLKDQIANRKKLLLNLKRHQQFYAKTWDKFNGNHVAWQQN